MRALDGLSLRVRPGCVYGLIGPNGAGKTTSIRLLMGILKPDRGHATVLGGQDPAQVKHLLGYLPEEKGLYQKMRVLELATFFGELKGMGRTAARAAASRWLQRLGLADHGDVRCDALSKGMGQKVQLICALLHDPQLVVLDEPFSGLDPVNAQLVREIIRDLKAANRGVILSTHIMEVAEQLCDEITLVNQGRDVLSGPVHDIIESSRQDRDATTLHIRYSGDITPLMQHPDVAKIDTQESGGESSATLHLAPVAKAAAVIDALAKQVALIELRTNTQSLHDIFVRAVGGTSATTSPPIETVEPTAAST